MFQMTLTQLASWLKANNDYISSANAMWQLATKETDAVDRWESAHQVFYNSFAHDIWEHNYQAMPRA